MSWGLDVRHTGDMPELIHPSQLDPRLTDLQRPQHSGFTAGLCRAVAERWMVDPLIVRLAVIALTFAGGVGVVLYGWGWLLTPREGDQPPVLRLLPTFGRWSLRTQGLVVAVSSLVMVLSLARQSGVAWGPVIIVAALAWGVARKRRRTSGTSTPAPGRVDVPSRGSDESVEQWRARVSAHGGSVLPTVDLYAPAAATTSATTPEARVGSRNSWWAALIILALTAAGAAIPVVLGLSPALLWALVAAAGTSAVLLLGWALSVRRRRLPGALLALALAGAVGTALLAMNHAQVSTVPLDTTSGGTAHYSFVGEAPAELDLTALVGDTTATVTIDATASVVRVRLSETPNSITVESDTINVVNRSPRGSTPGNIDLILDGDFSLVELDVVP